MTKIFTVLGGIDHEGSNFIGNYSTIERAMAVKTETTFIERYFDSFVIKSSFINMPSTIIEVHRSRMEQTEALRF